MSWSNRLGGKPLAADRRRPSARWGYDARSQSGLSISSEGLRPSDSPTRSLARRFAGSLRSRDSLRYARSLDYALVRTFLLIATLARLAMLSCERSSRGA